MAKYLVQHRRGTAEQWVEKNTIIPKEGEIVIEIDEINSLHKLKIGDGVHTYAELAYLMAGDEIITQVLTKTLPRVITVTLDINKWSEVTCETDPNLGYYVQTLTIDNITEYSRLDLQPNADMLAELQQLNLVFVTENRGGSISVCSIGEMPLKSYTMQATVVETEVIIDDNKIVGAPVGVASNIYETKEDAVSKLAEAKAYTDETVAQKSQVRVVTQDISEIVQNLTIYRLSQEEYNQKLENGTLEDHTLYLTPNEEIDLSGYATIENLESKANVAHVHDDIYNTKTEIATKLSTINTSLSDSLKEAKTHSNANLDTAKAYTDNAVSQKSLIQIVTWEVDD